MNEMRHRGRGITSQRTRNHLAEDEETPRRGRGNTSSIKKIDIAICMAVLLVMVMVAMLNKGDAFIPIGPIQGIASIEGIGEHNATRREIDREAFKSSPHSRFKEWFVDEFHHLTYCFIPKISCTKFKTLFYALATNGTRTDGTTLAIHYGPNGYHSTIGHVLASASMENVYQRVIKDVSFEWSTFIVLRDPAERLLSGFMDQCVRAGVCEGAKGSKQNLTVWFEEFAGRVNQKIETGRGVNAHFEPQHRFCGLETLYPKYVDHPLIFNKRTVEKQTLHFLREHNLEDYNEGYGIFRNETLFGVPTGHSTRGEDDDCVFYREFYTLDLYKRVRRAFGRDYELLGLPDPQWVNCLE